MFQLPTLLYSAGFPGEPMQQGDEVLVACWNGDLDAFKRALLREGQRRKLQSITEKNQSLVRILEKHLDNDQNNVLHVCAYRGSLNVINYLLGKVDSAAAHMSVDSRNKFQRTALHHACERDEVQVAAKLLQFGADPNACDINGYTPLHLAIEANSVLVAQYFIDNKLPLDQSTFSGLSPLLVACVNDLRFLACGLASAGADICKKSTLHDGIQHVTPLVVAQRNDWGERLRRAGAVPERPEPPYIVKKTDQEAMFQWLQPEGRSAPVEYYRLQVRKIDRLEPDLPWTTVAECVKDRSHTFYTCSEGSSTYDRAPLPEDLEPSEVYAVRVFAYSLVGWSEPSPPSQLFVTSPAAPSKPLVPEPVEISNTAITIRWQLPESNGAPIKYSEVQWRMSHSEWTTWSSIPVRVATNHAENSDDEPSSEESDTDEDEDSEKHIRWSQCKIEELAPQTFYMFRVRCYNLMGWSYFSDSTGKIMTFTQHGRRRQGLNSGVKDSVLRGAQHHAASRFTAIERRGLDNTIRRDLARHEAYMFAKNQRETAAVIVLQTFWRRQWARLKFLQYLYDREDRMPFLVEYGIVEPFYQQWRELLLKYKTQAIKLAEENQNRRDAKRRRKLERSVRRERRQLIRKAKAAAKNAKRDEN